MKTEKILWIIFSVSFIMRLLNIPTHGVITVMSLGLLSVIYFPGCFYFFSDKNIREQNFLVSGITGIVLSFISIAILYNLQSYPGHQLFMKMGLILGPILLGVAYFFRKKSEEKRKVYYKNIFTRTFVITGAILFFTFFTYNTIVKIQFHDDPEFARLCILAHDYPDNEQYKQDLWDYRNK